MVETKKPLPFDWVRHVSRHLLELDQKPLFGTSPSFPWEEFSQKLGGLFNIEDFAATAGVWQWRAKEELFDGLGEPLTSIPFAVSPLEGTAWLLIAKEQLDGLMSCFLGQDTKILKLNDQDYREAFTHFVALEAIHQWTQLEIYKNLSCALKEGDEKPQEDALCLDISLTCKDCKASARLVISPELQRAWRDHHSGPLSIKDSPLSPDLDVEISVEVGKTELALDAWKTVKVGDFLVLDACWAQPGQEKGRVILTLNGKPAFRGMIKEDKLKLLEYPLYQEVDTPMADEDLEEENNDFDEFDEELTDLDEEEEETEEEETEEAEEEEGEEEAAPKETEAEPAMKTSKAAEPAAEVAPEKLPLHISVEVARLSMDVKTLMELEPGNMLELDARPEQGVTLVADGRSLARGELIQIGDVLGVRILSVGS